MLTRLFVISVLAIQLLVVIVYLSLSWETGSISFQRFEYLFDQSHLIESTITQMRLTRLVNAFMVGGALALSGYLLQLLVVNPLADPYLLGTASGASLGANIVLMGFVPISFMGIYLPPVFACLGSILVTILVVMFAYRKRKINTTFLVLAGIALSSLLTSVGSILIFTSAQNEKMRTLIFWIMGNFDRAGMYEVGIAGIVLLAIAIVMHLFKKDIDLLLLGESRSANLGLHVAQTRWLLIIGSGLLTGIAVALAGAVGFVGIIIPHFIRAFFGVNGRFNVIFAVLLGGVFTTSSELAAKLLFPPAGVPVGLITSLVGIPIFLGIIFKSNYRF